MGKRKKKAWEPSDDEVKATIHKAIKDLSKQVARDYGDGLADAEIRLITSVYAHRMAHILSDPHTDIVTTSKGLIVVERKTARA